LIIVDNDNINVINIIYEFPVDIIFLSKVKSI